MSQDLRDKYKVVRVEITTVDAPTIGHPRSPKGLGQNAETVSVEGRAVKIVVCRNNAAEFGIHILGNGSIILTSYKSELTSRFVERHHRFTNERPWE